MSAIAVAIGVAAAATVASVVMGAKAQKAQSQALAEQKRAQEQQAQNASMMEEKATRRIVASQKKRPDVSGIMAAAQEAASGPSSTMLTGPMGVNPQDLALGRTSLLGG